MPPTNKISLFFLVLLAHVLLLIGLSQQTSHSMVRQQSHVLRTLIFQPMQRPRIQPNLPLPNKAVTEANQKQTNTTKTLLTPSMNPAPTTPPQTLPTTTASNVSPVRTSPHLDTHYPCPAPIYPPNARRNGEEGRVLLSFYINETGQVTQSKVVQSSGFESLDKAALAALSQCRFKPATEGNHPVAIWATIPYIWRIN